MLPTGVLTSTGGNGFISPLLLLEQDNGGVDDPSHAVWLQTSFFVGAGDNKGSSFINVALGEWDPETGITGARRGGSIVLGPDENSDPRTYSFSGDIASLEGPDESHFLGSENPNIVIGADSTGTHNIFRDTPLNPAGDNSSPEDQSGATYHVGVGQTTDLQPTPTLVKMNGYAAGLAQHPGSGRPDFVANFSPNDVTLNFDAATNTMTGSFKLKDIAPTALGAILTLLNKAPQFNLGFGGPGRSAFIDDNTFAAIEKKSGASLQVPGIFNTKTYAASVEGFIVSADAIQANQILFAGQTVQTETGPQQKRAFCQSCDFIRWGAWGARVACNNQVPTWPTGRRGWWIVGDVVNKLPREGSASYTGDAIGNVTNNGKQYVATGDMSMSWNFGTRTGQLDITHFDGKDFGGTMCGAGLLCPNGNNHFAGVLSGSGVAGTAAGSFVGPTTLENGKPDIPKGVIGNFGVTGNHYQATGIFGGTAPR